MKKASFSKLFAELSGEEADTGGRRQKAKDEFRLIS